MIKAIGVNVFIALILTIPIVVWASPLSNFAVGLIFLLCLGLISTLQALFKKSKTKEKKSKRYVLIFIIVSAYGCNGPQTENDQPILSKRDTLPAFAQRDTLPIAHADTIIKNEKPAESTKIVKKKKNKNKWPTPIIINEPVPQDTRPTIPDSKPVSPPTTEPPKPLISSRSFLYPFEEPRCDFGAYGYILFTRKKNILRNNSQKLLRIAELFKANFESTKDYIKIGIKPNELMVMYWFADTYINLESSSEQMIKNYDYVRASVLLRDINKSGSEGPIFVAWPKSCPKLISEQTVPMVFDLSKFDDSDLERAFDTWVKRVSTNPSCWDTGFKMETFRSEFRNFFNTYGECMYLFATGKKP